MRKDLFDKIYTSIEKTPKEWSYGYKKFTLENKKTGIDLWTGNGFLFMDIYSPVEGTHPMTFIQKIRLSLLISSINFDTPKDSSVMMIEEKIKKL